LTVAFVFVVALNKVIILPKTESEHFRRIIIQSMINRHANYVKDSDTHRASAMSMFMEKLGMPVSDLIARLNKDRDA
jgi:hypothetical protein